MQPGARGGPPRAGLLEGRWTVSILWASSEGASRFNELKQAVGEIPPRSPSGSSSSSRRACSSGVFRRAPAAGQYTLTEEATA